MVYAYGDEKGTTSVKEHIITIEIFPEKHSFRAVDEMLVHSSGQSLMFRLNKGFDISSVKVDGRKKKFDFKRGPERDRERTLSDENMSTGFSRAGILSIETGSSGEFRVSIEYKGMVYEEPSTSQFSREYIANQTSGIISEEGIFLSPECFWYPKGDEKMSLFEIQTITPEDYETVTQGSRLTHEYKSNKLNVRWKNNTPSDVLFLQAGQYEIQEDQVEGIKVYTYFFKGGKSLASLYLKKSIQYIAMFKSMLGRYPYEKFAVVENFFETGYGMPSWTLLGRTVVRLPFIPDTSLPHEICHNWWGNGVFVDYESGNWCEGLTVYCADYLLKKQTIPDGDVEYRRQINRDYASYVKGNNDVSLSEFRSRQDPATRAVGYGKAMMVFHALQRMIGEDKFFECLRSISFESRFKTIGWKDIFNLFERRCGIDLEHFYDIWIARPGAPELRIEGVWSQKQREEYSVTFYIVQEGDKYDLDVPVVLTTENGELKENFKVGNSIQTCEILSQYEPLRLEVDPEHHIFRKLYPVEIPPSIAKVFGSSQQTIILGTSDGTKRLDEYKQAAELINKTRTADIRLDSEVTDAELKTRSVIFLGNPAERTLASDFFNSIKITLPWELEQEEDEDIGAVIVINHPKQDEFGVMVIRGNEQSDILSIARKIPHYGKYSYLLFSGDENIVKGIWEIELSPLIHVFR
jgi:hypothetical protein